MYAPQKRSVADLPKPQVLTFPDSAGVRMSTEEVTRPVWINLTTRVGVIYQHHKFTDELWDLQPIDNPHEVAWHFAKELIAEGRAEWATAEEIADAIETRAKERPPEAPSAKVGRHEAYEEEIAAARAARKSSKR